MGKGEASQYYSWISIMGGGVCDLQPWASQAAPVVKSPPVNAGSIRDAGSVPELGSLHGNPLQCSYLGNPMPEEPGGLQSMGSQVRHDEPPTLPQTIHRNLKQQQQLEMGNKPPHGS